MSNNNNNPENKAPNPGTKDALKAENEALKAKLEAMKAQAEKDAAAKAELEALKAQMAVNQVAVNQEAVNQTEPEPPVVPDEERVEIFVEKGYANDEPNQIISVNGVLYVLPKGKTSNVPKFVADEYRRSQRAKQRLDETVDKMLAEASK